MRKCPTWFDVYSVMSKHKEDFFNLISNFLSLFLQIDHHGIPNIGNTGVAGGSSTNNSGMHTSMTSSLHRRSLQDVDALGLFHHGRGLGRHLSRQSSDDSRRRSSANLQNLAGSVTHLAGSMTGRTAIIFFSYSYMHIISEDSPIYVVYCSQIFTCINDRSEMY